MPTVLMMSNTTIAQIHLRFLSAMSTRAKELLPWVQTQRCSPTLTQLRATKMTQSKTKTPKTSRKTMTASKTEHLDRLKPRLTYSSRWALIVRHLCQAIRAIRIWRSTLTNRKAARYHLMFRLRTSVNSQQLLWAMSTRVLKLSRERLKCPLVLSNLPTVPIHSMLKTP